MQTIIAPLTPGPELLQGHIAATGITQAAFAQRVSVSKGYLTQLLTRTRKPSLDLAIRIEKVTDGIVPVQSWSSSQQGVTK